MSNFNLKFGSELTFAHEVIGHSGRILFEKGSKAIISEIITTPASVGRMSGVYYPEKIEAVRIEESLGLWYSGAFVERFL